MGRVRRYLAALAAYSLLLAILGKSFAYILSWFVLPFALIFAIPVQLVVGPFDYILAAEALIFFAIAFAVDAKAPNVGKWFARIGLMLCFAQITFLLSEKGVGR